MANNIGIDSIYNGDQAGLWYRKLPNCMYFPEDVGKSKRGTKQMKDKDRITMMVCTSATGLKIPLAVIGTAATPECFRDLANNSPPLPYNHQSNAYFDQNIFHWWLTEVFAKNCEGLRNGGKVLLILDNAKIQVDVADVPVNIIIRYLPANLTSMYQPMDQGVIRSLKIGYKQLMLEKLLEICDNRELYNERKAEAALKRRGQKGLQFACKAHIVDAMNLLNNIWNSPVPKYCTTNMIQGCFRRSKCLPKTLSEYLLSEDQSMEQLNVDVLEAYKKLQVSATSRCCGW